MIIIYKKNVQFKLFHFYFYNSNNIFENNLHINPHNIIDNIYLKIIQIHFKKIIFLFFIFIKLQQCFNFVKLNEKKMLNYYVHCL